MQQRDAHQSIPRTHARTHMCVFRHGTTDATRGQAHTTATQDKQGFGCCTATTICPFVQHTGCQGGVQLILSHQCNHYQKTSEATAGLGQSVWSMSRSFVECDATGWCCPGVLLQYPSSCESLLLNPDRVTLRACAPALPACSMGVCTAAVLSDLGLGWLQLAGGMVSTDIA